MGVAGYCNAYGAETGGATPFGGFLRNEVTTQPECHAPAAHRFRWVCEHGHRGSIVPLCEWHWAEFSGRAAARFDGGEGYERQFNGSVLTVPWNIRRDVQSCPRCAAEAPDCTDPEHIRLMRGKPGRCGCRQHKCAVRLELVS
jgi:hypothetical protein